MSDYHDPEHNPLRTGKNGLYCPTRLEDETWCDWTPDDPKHPRRPPPTAHLSGREYLAVARGAYREPPRPYTFECRGLTPVEYDEILMATARLARLARITAPTP